MCAEQIAGWMQGLGAPESAAPEEETAQLLDIVYEDEYLLVVNKPAGLVSFIFCAHHRPFSLSLTPHSPALNAIF